MWQGGKIGGARWWAPPAPHQLPLLEPAGVFLNDGADVVAAQQLHGRLALLADRVNPPKEAEQRLHLSLVRDVGHLAADAKPAAKLAMLVATHPPTKSAGNRARPVDGRSAERLPFGKLLGECRREPGKLADLGVVGVDSCVRLPVGDQLMACCSWGGGSKTESNAQPSRLAEAPT